MNAGTDTPTLAQVNVEQEEAKLTTEIQPVVQQANAIQVRNAVEFEGAAGFLKNIKASQKRVTDFFGPIKAAAHAAWKRTTEGEATFLKPLQEAEKTVKTRMVTWQAEQERIAERERLRLQAIEDERIRKEQEKLAKQIATAEKNGKAEKAEALREQAATVAPVVIQAQAATPTVKGIATKKVCKVAGIDMNAMGIPVAVQGFIEVKTGALERVKAANPAFELPGVTWRVETIMAAGSR